MSERPFMFSNWKTLICLLAIPSLISYWPVQVRSTVKTSELAPIVIIPGLAASKLEVSTEEKPWQLLWINFRELLNHESFINRLKLLYQDEEGVLKIQNQQGVEIRAQDFGGVDGITRMHQYIPFDKMSKLVRNLKRSGWSVGSTLFAAPYDWRHAAIGLQEMGFYGDFSGLIEQAVNKTGEKAVLVGHSLGSLVTAHFLQQQSQEWKDHYVKNFISLAAPFGGCVHTLKAILRGEVGGIPFFRDTMFYDIQSTCTSGFWLTPRKHLWGEDEVLIETGSKNYTGVDLKELFTDAGMAPQASLLDDLHDLDVWRNTKSLGVRTICLYGTNVRTTSKLIYDEDKITPNLRNMSGPKLLKSMDGDGMVNSRSLRQCNEFADEFHEFDKVGHRAILEHPEALDIIVKAATVKEEVNVS